MGTVGGRRNHGVGAAARYRTVPKLFGDYHFAFAHAATDAIPQPVRSDTQAVSRILGESFVAGEFRPDGEVQLVAALATAAFDLAGDLTADLIFSASAPAPMSTPGGRQGRSAAVHGGGPDVPLRGEQWSRLLHTGHALPEGDL